MGDSKDLHEHICIYELQLIDSFRTIFNSSNESFSTENGIIFVLFIIFIFTHCIMYSSVAKKLI